MTDRLKVRAVLALLAVTLAGCAQFNERDVTTPLAAAADPPIDHTRVDPRVAGLQKGMAAKLKRKPKAEREAANVEWLTQWGARQGNVPFDQPQSALTHFMAKRLVPGNTSLGPAEYAPALEYADRMPVYSTVMGRFVATRDSRGGSVVSPVTQDIGLSGAWSALGPGNIGGRTRALVIHPTTPTTMWAGGVAGGIWKSTDAGASWQPKADLLVNIAISTLVIDPRNPNVLYAGTGEGFFNGDALRGAGILKSTDGGETWTQLPATIGSDFQYVQKIVISAGASQRLYAATRSGLMRSSDGGATWSKQINAATVNGCMDAAIQTDRALAMVFASCGTFAQGTVYRALDSAGTQNFAAVLSLTNMGRTGIALAPSNQNILYALASSTATGSFQYGLLGVYRSTASGAPGSWTTQVTNTSTVKLNTTLLTNPVYAFLSECGFGTGVNLNQGWYDLALAVDPADPNIVWAGGIDLFRSNDGGQNWGQASHWWFTRGTDPEYNHADQHTLVFHPQYNGSTNRTLYTGNDGGVLVTTDARAPVSFSPAPVTAASPVCGNTAAGVMSWQDRNSGYQITQFYHGIFYPDGSTFLGGTQDNGTLRGSLASGANAWTTVSGGDGGYVAVNPANTSMLWTEFTGLSIQRSVNGGSSYSAFTSGISEAAGNFLFITPFTQDPTVPANMWIGGATMWRTGVATAASLPSPIWTQASTFFGTRVSAIGVSPLNSNRVYAGTQSGAVFTNGAALTATSGSAWTSSAPRPDVNYVSWVQPDPVLAGTVYATVSTFNSATGIGHVFKSTNFGASWVRIDGSGSTAIPDVPAHSIAIDPADNQRLYVGTDIGVFVSIDGGINWARENTGFANVVTEALAIKSTVPRYIYAFTHGRSSFRAPLP